MRAETPLEHVAIIEAMEEGDRGYAEQLMRSHTRKSRDRIAKILTGKRNE